MNDHDDHDDHEGHDQGPDESGGLRPGVEGRHQERLAAVLAGLSDGPLSDLVAALPQHSRVDLVAGLGLPKQTAHLGGALVPLLRRKLAAASEEKRLLAAFTLTDAVNEETIAALGPRHDDPSRDDMIEVLPPIVERHGAEVATLMLATYAASDAACREVFADLLDTDERFAVPEPAVPAGGEGDAEAGSEPAVEAAPETAVDPEREAQLEKRKAAKAARREAAKKQRAASVTAQEKQREARHRAKRRRS